eukprot:CAMPEP_0194358852 /NCGR_PEP_ID=MMETSP0174-20130528/6066_1 /TAXON_ID=216777 /ORGANISM="Proboscia alata, Strain PI-D3" /LENGTH=649 /DNA_ID=CAMNT_0039129409 /DNA_START=244 /DNA_END=2190 /DNA_ORIENTATION=+
MANGGNSDVASNLKLSFQDIGVKLSSDMVKRCTAISTSLHLPPTQLCTLWETYALNANIDNATPSSIDAFHSKLLSDKSLRPRLPQEVEGAVVPRVGISITKSPEPPSLVTPTKRKPDESADVLASSSSSKPRALKMEKKPKISISLPLYAERVGSGDVTTVYNPANLPPTPNAPATSQLCTVEPVGNRNILEPYRYMHTPVEMRAKCLNEWLETLGRDVIVGCFSEETKDTTKDVSKPECEDLTDLEADCYFEQVSLPHQETFRCIGRICNESHTGKLNRTSVLLEGTHHHAGGSRLKLNLTSTTLSYSLFPGQIVGVEGTNPSGREIVVSKIWDGVPPPSAGLTPKTENQSKPNTGKTGNGLSVIMASGPFTTSDNLEYEPLVDLLSYVQSQTVDVVILTGPFVDVTHPSLANEANDDDSEEDGCSIPLEDGTRMQVSHETLFVTRISDMIAQLYEGDAELQTQFLLIPHPDDAVGEPVVPQPPLANRLDTPRTMETNVGTLSYGSLDLDRIVLPGVGKRAVHCLPNPCTFKLNDTVFGATSVDALFQLNAQEVNHGAPAPGGRMARLAQHLLHQQSYHPIYPPAEGTLLDLQQWQSWGMPVQPDVLMLPGRLSTFGKNVEGTLVVNPGRLARGTTGGSFARLVIPE